MDTIFWLRIAYTVVGILGSIWAIRCLRQNYMSIMLLRFVQEDKSLLDVANAYIRRDLERVAILLLVGGAGVVALIGSLELRSVFGLVVLLLIALVATYGSWADCRYRKATVSKASPLEAPATPQ